MSDQIFRKKSLDRISSPEQLNDISGWQTRAYG